MVEDTETNKNNRQPFITFKIPFIGIEIKFGGRELFSVIILFTLATPIIYLLVVHDIKLESFMKAQVEATEAFTYVITLSPEERVKLNLAKPKKIREMERGGY